jgi:hypothetical protein
MTRTPEGITQMQIIHYLKALGAVVGKTKTMGVKRGKVFCFDPYLFRGFPDLTFFYNKRLFFCEVKSPKGKQSEMQILFEQQCKEADIPYILARDVSDVEAAIRNSK